MTEEEFKQVKEIHFALNDMLGEAIMSDKPLPELEAVLKITRKLLDDAMGVTR